MAVLPSAEPPSGTYKSEGQRTRLNKRKLVSDALMQTRDELFAGEFDGCGYLSLSLHAVFDGPGFLQANSRESIRPVLHPAKAIPVPGWFCFDSRA